MKVNILKILLACLILVCLFDMPYGYYQLVRFLASCGFAILAFQSHKQKNETGLIIFIVLALLFQPFIKVALGRQIWNIVDVIVGVGLIANVLIDFYRMRKGERLIRK